MTDLLLNEKPARSGRGKKLILLLVFVLAAGLAVLGWLYFAPGSAPVPPAETAIAPEPETNLAVSAPAPAVAPDPALALLADAQEAKTAGKLEDAREAALSVLDQSSNQTTRGDAEAILNDVDMQLLMTPRAMPEKSDYTVAAGDSLDKIAHAYGTTVELIQKSNNLRGALIREGDRLRVFSGQWEIRVNKNRNDLVLYLNHRFFKRYRVGTGEYSKTPVGEFKITDRIAQPTWWHPDGRTIPYGDPENLLGTHWLALDIKGYGLHGTWEPDTIGKQSSAGCVRLLNKDIEELYTLAPIGTPVVIEE